MERSLAYRIPRRRILRINEATATARAAAPAAAYCYELSNSIPSPLECLSR